MKTKFFITVISKNGDIAPSIVTGEPIEADTILKQSEYIGASAIFIVEIDALGRPVENGYAEYRNFESVRKV